MWQVVNRSKEPNQLKIRLKYNFNSQNLLEMRYEKHEARQTNEMYMNVELLVRIFNKTPAVYITNI